MMLETPMVFTAWGFQVGGNWETSAKSLGSLLVGLGFKTVAVQISTAPQARAQELRDKGLKVIAWDDFNAHPVEPNADFSHVDGLNAQIESPAQYDAALRFFKGRTDPGPRSIGTTYAGLETPPPGQPGHGARWKALADAGVTQALVECYAADGQPHEDIGRMLWQGEQYGIPRSALVPVCGTYRGELPSAYPGLTGVGRNFGLWIAEPMTQAQWIEWAKIANPPAPAPAPVPIPTSEQVKAAAVIDLNRWLTTRPGPETLSRIRVAWRILSSGPEWTGAAPQVVKVLDDAGVRKV